MPQDIPLEASEELVFTPKAFANLGSAPSFVLRAATARDKRYHRRLHLEENIVSHTAEAIRAEILRGLKSLWSAETYDQHAEVLTAFWAAQDDYDQQRGLHAKEQEGLPEDKRVKFPEFDYDPEIREACEELTRKVIEAWRPVRSMVADNADFAELTAPAMVAVVLKSWRGLQVKVTRERGYLTLSGAMAIEEALGDFEEQHGIVRGSAWTELFVACTRRMYLDEAEAKNSASPSPSDTPQPVSNPIETTAADGPSPASAISSATPDIS